MSNMKNKYLMFINPPREFNQNLIKVSLKRGRVNFT